MSRSWERKVRKNMEKVNQTRKKNGMQSLGGSSAAQVERFRGRNIFLPILLVLFVFMYWLLAGKSNDYGGIWLIAGCYVFLAIVFFFRRPYLSVGTDYVQTRRMTGDKRLGVQDIKKIVLQKGYVVVEPNKGSNWVFSRVLNRYPTEAMGEHLRKFAGRHGLQVEER